jgi:hypothetical protein
MIKPLAIIVCGTGRLLLVGVNFLIFTIFWDCSN